MLSVHKIKSVFRYRKNPDRVYMIEDGTKPRNVVTRFYKALGLKPRDRKYNPEKFDPVLNPLPQISSALWVLPTKAISNSPSNLNTSEFDDELELDIIDLELDVPRDASLGDQEEPEQLIIAFEYPEEEMPLWFHLGYGCDPGHPRLSFLGCDFLVLSQITSFNFSNLFSKKFSNFDWVGRVYLDNKTFMTTLWVWSRVSPSKQALDSNSIHIS